MVYGRIAKPNHASLGHLPQGEATKGPPGVAATVEEEVEVEVASEDHLPATDVRSSSTMFVIPDWCYTLQRHR